MLGGRRLVKPLARRGGALQMAMGAIMVVVALAMWGEYDLRFQRDVTANLPSFLVNPAESLENTDSAQAALIDIRGITAHGIGTEVASGAEPRGAGASKRAAIAKGPDSGLPVYGEAPEFTGTERWFNTPGNRPLTMRGLRGRVVLIDFWTYSCINCIRTLPYLNAWNQRYAKDGLTIVGVHTPEFPFEREASNVEAAISREGIEYPVVQDNEQGTWNAYGNQYWPAEYFVDASGHVRFAHFGEGDYGEKEKVIRELLAEAGHRVGRGESGAHGIEPSAGVTTPETYLGAARAERFTNPELSPGLHDFSPPSGLPANEFAYHGKWRIALDSATAAGGSLDLNFGARRVYLVLGSPGQDRRVKVKLDGRPIPAADAGSDVHGGTVTVTSQRLYNLVEMPKVENHVLELEPEAGVMGYAFTFG
jgi:thiol-disulfide isomerase/thioredoxin